MLLNPNAFKCIYPHAPTSPRAASDSKVGQAFPIQMARQDEEARRRTLDAYPECNLRTLNLQGLGSHVSDMSIIILKNSCAIGVIDPIAIPFEK